MSESLVRPSWLRSRSHVPGSFNTEDELSPIKSSFDMDDTYHTLDASTASPGAPMENDDSSLQLPKHDDTGGERSKNNSIDDTFDKEISMADNDSNLSMIASNTIPRLGSSDVQSFMGVSLRVHENGPPPSPEHGRDDVDATKTSTTPSEGPAPPDNLASSSPTLSSKLSTQPFTLQAQPVNCSTTSQLRLHRSDSIQTVTTASRKRPRNEAFLLSELIALVTMYKLLTKERFEQMLEHLIEKYLLVTPEDSANITSQPSQSEQVLDNHASLYDASDVDGLPSSGYDETNVRPPVSDSDRPMSPLGSKLGLRAQSDSLDRLTKDNFDLRVKVSYLQKKIDEFDDDQLEKITRENIELKADIVKSTKVSQGSQELIRDLEAQLKSSEKKVHRAQLEQKTTTIRINDLKVELKETETEMTELRSRTNIEKEGFNKRIAENDAVIKRITETNDELLREVKAHTLMLTSRTNERDSLIAQVEELKSSIESRRSSSDESRASNSERERYEDRIANLEDHLSASKLAELSTAKKYQAKRNECDELHSMVEHLDGLLDKKGDRIDTLKNNFDTLKQERNHLRNEVSTLNDNMANIHHDLKTKVQESDTLREALAENETLLKTRTALMETSVVETQRLTEQVDKERQLRRQEKLQHEQLARTQQHTTRLIIQKDGRITELEAARTSDRKKLNTLEQQSKDQIAERNQLLLSIWHRLSTVCGTDWQHQNNLVNGHLPTFDVVNNMLPAFTKNLMLAVKCIEKSVGTFTPRLGHVEQNLARDIESLERNLEMKSRRLERLEGQVLAHDARMNLQQNTANTAETGEKRWMHRLKELERRLKAEREGRLLDRSAARDRINEEKDAMQRLRQEMERMGGRLD